MLTSVNNRPDLGRYWWCDWLVSSERALPTLIKAGFAGPAEADVHVRSGDPTSRVEWQTEPKSDAEAFVTIGRLSDGRLGAQFNMQGNPWIRIDAAKSLVTLEGMFHPYLAIAAVNLGLPLLAAESGRTVLHAGAFCMGADAHVIVAHSGVGKSTFIARAAQRGARTLSDDCVVIDRNAAAAEIVGTGAPTRLHPDSAALLGITWSEVDILGKLSHGGRSARAIATGVKTIVELMPNNDATAAHLEEVRGPLRVKLLDEHSIYGGPRSRTERAARLTNLVQLAADYPLKRLVYHKSVQGVDAAIDLLGSS